MTGLSLHAFLKGRDSQLALSLLGPPSGRLLDIGSGEGEDLRILLEDGWQAIGLDPFSEVHRVPWVRGSAEQLPFKDKTFVAVTCILVLPHLRRPDRAVAEAYRVLRTDGRALFVVFSKSPLNLKGAVRREGYTLNGMALPYRLFSKRELESLLQSVGFVPVVSTRTDFMPMLTGWLGHEAQARILARLESADRSMTDSPLGRFARKLIVAATRVGPITSHDSPRGG